jgi:hypothetical protein
MKNRMETKTTEETNLKRINKYNKINKSKLKYISK